MSALANPGFRRLLLGQSLSTFGDTALYLTLGIWAKDLTGSNALAGSVFLALTVPSLASPLVGHLVDRYQRRTVMVINNIGAALVVLSLLVVRGGGQLWLMYLVAAALGLSATVLGSARGGLLKDLVPIEDLAGANAAFQTLGQGLRLVSPLVGAGLYATIGGPALVVLDVAALAVASVALLSIRVVESEPEPVGEEPFRRRVMAGFRHLRRSPLLTRLAGSNLVAWSVIGLYETASFAVIDTGLGRPPSFLGVLVTIQGAGAVLGGLCSARVVRRLGEARAVGAGIGLLAAAAALLCLPALAPVAAGMVLAGVGLPWISVGLSTAVQRLTPARLLGRAGAAVDVLITGPQTASIALGAVLISVLDYRLLIATIAVVLTACAAWLAAPIRAPEQADNSAKNRVLHPS